MITIENINETQKRYGLSIILRRRVIGSNSKITYRLMETLKVKLYNGEIITIPKGFEWDLSSVPRIFWWLLPPDGDFEFASLIHDYLYKNQELNPTITRKISDKELLIWSKVVSGTNNNFSLRNIDNWIRYIFVRIFGGFVWRKVIKI